jgi:DNA-directed RNA polymerase subunit RPC12/RpoP
MKEWTTYVYVCTNCDTLIEMTTKRTTNKEPNCTCKNSGVILISKELSTIKVVA